MSKVIRYEHHGVDVAVREDLKGKHREFCLCHQCGRFKPGPPENNCPVANLLFAVCIAQNVVTPVWECANFSLREEKPNEQAPRPV